MRRLILFGGILMLALGTAAGFMPAQVSAQCGSPVACERAADSCLEGGGNWDGNTGRCIEDECSGSGSFLGLPTWYKYLEMGEVVERDQNGQSVVVDECGVIGPVYTSGPQEGNINWQAASGRIALAIIEILLRLAALAAVAYVIYGGFRFITSQGDPVGAKNARYTILNGLIGLVISMIATGAVAFISNTLTS